MLKEMHPSLHDQTCSLFNCVSSSTLCREFTVLIQSLTPKVTMAPGHDLLVSWLLSKLFKNVFFARISHKNMLFYCENQDHEIIRILTSG